MVLLWRKESLPSRKQQHCNDGQYQADLKQCDKAAAAYLLCDLEGSVDGSAGFDVLAVAAARQRVEGFALATCFGGRYARGFGDAAFGLGDS